MPRINNAVSFGICILLLASFANSLEFKVTHQVFFDIAIDGEDMGRMEIGLFGEIAPKTVDNFYTIATEGINGKSYTGSKFHRVMRKFMIQGGDIVNGDGSGSISIYGKSFEDENFIVNHTGPGFISMANAGENTNGCQFFITTISTPWLDGKHTVFGKVIKGQRIVHQIELVKTDVDDYPLKIIEITKSGSLPTPDTFYVSAEHQYTLWTWVTAGSVPLTFSFAILTFFQYLMYKLDHVKDKYD